MAKPKMQPQREKEEAVAKNQTEVVDDKKEQGLIFFVLDLRGSEYSF